MAGSEPTGDAAEAEVDAALAAGATSIDAALARRLLDDARAHRELAAQRWRAVTQLAPAAKQRRQQAQDLARAALEAAAALATTQPALATRLTELARVALPVETDGAQR